MSRTEMCECAPGDYGAYSQGESRCGPLGPVEQPYLNDASESCRSACLDRGGLFPHFERLPPPFGYLPGPASQARPSEEIGSVRRLRGRRDQSVVAELGRGQNVQLARVRPSPGLPVEYGDFSALQPVPVLQSRGPFPGRDLRRETLRATGYMVQKPAARRARVPPAQVPAELAH